MYKKILIILSISFLFLASCSQNIETENTNLDNNQENQVSGDNNSSSENGEETSNLENNTENNMTENTANFNQTDKPQNGDLVAVMKTTNGTMKFRLFLDKAPKTVLNFVGLAQKGYYKDIIFHRVIKDFMIQGGDPTGTGTGGESYWGGSFEDEFSDNLSNIRGALSMANSGANTNGSQFFVVQKDSTYLDNKHSVFGQVYEGLDTVDKIAKTKTTGDKPDKDIKIISVEIKKYNNGKLDDVTMDVDSELTKYEEIKQKEEEAKAEADKNREVKAGDIIAVDYTGKLENGEVFDSSIGKAPLEFEVGAGGMIKGFDEGVVGMKLGEKKTLTLSPEEAYGEYSEDNIQEIPDAQLVQAGIPLEVGQTFFVQGQGVKITAVNEKENKVTVDFNHQLAGKTLIFDVELKEFKN